MKTATVDTNAESNEKGAPCSSAEQDTQHQRIAVDTAIEIYSRLLRVLSQADSPKLSDAAVVQVYRVAASIYVGRRIEDTAISNGASSSKRVFMAQPGRNQ